MTNDLDQDRANRIAQLNDDLRRYPFLWGKLNLTIAVKDFLDRDGARFNRLLKALRDGKIEVSNDPYAEHDFGTIMLEGRQLFWKIDYYDNDYQFASPDPTDPDQTRRVLTVMLPHEY